ncbi:FAD-dependent oxidoreductase [Microbacterium sp. 18062]|uniref:FAD-dependent oxidoreductase n=1 Tax=Microbacterium sp. 18062 TaxID=2681410 RepID=UPI00135A832C|nr:FAD-dependent oxidoreductase [Microbacterium sp. 18062]
MTRPRRVIVLGGGLAANTFVAQARALGFDGDLDVLAAESRTPYARPPLSKAVLTGAAPPESTSLPFDPAAARFRRGVAAVAVDPVERLVTASDGTALPYDALLVATGSSARVPGPGTLTVRTIDDVTVLRDRLTTARTALIVGSGFLAWELAAGCVAAGVDTTVVTRPAPLARTLGTELAAMLISRARAAGARHVVAADPIVRADAGGTAVAVGASILRGDVMIGAVGCASNTAALPARWRSARAGGAIEIDELSRVRAGGGGGLVPDVYAAGDVTARVLGAGSARSPLWTAAIAQAVRAARTMLEVDGPTLSDDVPYCWTEAFGVEIRLAGVVPSGITPLIDGEGEGGALWRWPGAAAAVNRTMPIPRLKRLTVEPVPAHEPVDTKD